MKKIFAIAGMFALAAALGSTTASAQGKSGSRGSHGGGPFLQSGHPGANEDGLRSLARADEVAGTHGLKGRDIARTRGANKTGFCPPGQKKKAGLGSRFQC